MPLIIETCADEAVFGEMLSMLQVLQLFLVDLICYLAFLSCAACRHLVVFSFTVFEEADNDC